MEKPQIFSMVKIPWGKLLAPIIVILIMTYFAFHTIQGDRGILAWNRLIQAKEEALEKKKALEATHEALDRKVRLLRPRSLSLDLLGEKVREKLYYAAPNEVILDQSKAQSPSGDLFQDLQGNVNYDDR